MGNKHKSPRTSDVTSLESNRWAYWQEERGSLFQTLHFQIHLLLIFHKIVFLFPSTGSFMHATTELE